MSDPNIGRLLGKRYQLQELVGTGAMGRVYRAKDVLLGGVPVAVKFLALSIQNEKMRLQERFEREAKTCALLGQKSIHIVRVMDYGVDEKNTPYYVMEYLQGQSLSSLVRKENLTLPRFISMARQICLGLQCAHNGIPVDGVICPIIHRDIKPSNMLVIQDPSFGELVKVLDFGIAKLVMSDSDQTKFYLGTLAYSSPEQIEGKELDNRSDIYSLGVMMFEMLTSKMPLIPASHSFGAWYKTHHYQQPRSFAEVAPHLEIPQQIQDLIMGCLAKSPSDRPQTISEILNTLAFVEQQDHLRHPNVEVPVVNHNSAVTTPSEPKQKTESPSHPKIQPNNQPATTPAEPESKVKQQPKTELQLTPIAQPQSKIESQFTPTLEPQTPKVNSSPSPSIEQKTTTDVRLAPIYDEIASLVTWPPNKPIADIVFPQPIPTKTELLPALWVMLPRAEIQKRLVCTRYNQFLFISHPHPMVLWITVIYNRKHEAKWLPQYLDLKTHFAQETLRLLQHKGSYYLLMFTKERPNRCTHVLSSAIAPAQRDRLHEWVQTSSLITPTADAQVSKNLLKQEYEKIKSHILNKLEIIDTDSPFDMSG
ncbi:MAG TPA: protein kinase [Nostocaceae cyanobacterium]|nr:protein kinase [Nostocaceae cyanobacterium]